MRSLVERRSASEKMTFFVVNWADGISKLGVAQKVVISYVIPFEKEVDSVHTYFVGFHPVTQQCFSEINLGHGACIRSMWLHESERVHQIKMICAPCQFDP